MHIEFTEGQDKITVEGPPEEVSLAVKALEKIVQDLVSIELLTSMLNRMLQGRRGVRGGEM